MSPDTGQIFEEIRHGAWLVRHYGRGARSEIQRAQRQNAIRQLGLSCRAAFNATEDFEPLFQTILDGLIPKEEPRF